MRTAKVTVHKSAMNARMVNTTSDIPVSAERKLALASDLGFNMGCIIGQRTPPERTAFDRLLWSGRRESNPRGQLGKLKFYH